jgi:aryl-alcohol dehydrogenase-like predicted oxidoreductase
MPFAEKHDASLAQLVINWTVNRPGITCALVGARNVEQVNDNVRALSFNLSQQELDEITAIAGHSHLQN